MKSTKVIIFLFLIIFALVIHSGPKKVEASDTCWQKSNGHYSFGDSNRDYTKKIDCESCYIIYSEIVNGTGPQCLPDLTKNGKITGNSQTFDTKDQCRATLLSNYNMSETRPSATRAPTCNYSNESASWRNNLQAKITALYAELLKRTTNENDFAYWQSAMPFRNCGQAIDEAGIRAFIQASDEYKNVQSLLSSVQSVATNQSVGVQPVTKTETPKTGFWNYIESIPSQIAIFFKRIF